LLLLTLVWSVGWFLVQRQIKQQLDIFISNEAAKDRYWSCETAGQKGFPFKLVQDCAAVAVAGPQSMRVELRGASLVWRAIAPNSLVFTALSPARGQFAAMTFNMDWAEGHVEIAPLLGQMAVQASLTQLKTHVVKPLTAPSGRVGDRGSVAQVQIKAGPFENAAANSALPDRLPVVVAAHDIQDDALGIALATSSLANIDFVGAITATRNIDGANLAEKLEFWRHKSGQVEVTKLEFSAGDLRVFAEGAVVLDEEHRIKGKLNLRIAGGDGLMAKLGYAPSSSIVGGLLGGLLHAKGADGQAQGVSLPLRLEDGFVFLGPVRLPLILTPLY